jgi:hypothetical protein
VISEEEIRDKARKLWASGKVARASLGAESLFPYFIPFRKPTAQEWLDRFASLRMQVDALESRSKSALGIGYTVSFKETAHQKLGRLRVPQRVFFETSQDVAYCAGEVEANLRFQRLAATLLSREPRLSDWLSRHPLWALELERDLPRLIGVLKYFEEHPRPMLYARQLGIPGVDSKFVEEYRAVLADWLQCVLPSEAIDSTARGVGEGAFEKRFGLLYEEPQVRFRWLDRNAIWWGAISDATVPLSEFARYAPPCKRIFITENKVNFLTLPAAKDSIAVFGGGYAVDRLRHVPWLQSKALHYWGDIDTHGFAILSQLRSSWPHVESFLMDSETLFGHKDLWTEETSNTRCLYDLPNLNEKEHELFDNLRMDRLRVRVRLEQERIEYEWVIKALESVTMHSVSNSGCPGGGGFEKKLYRS